MKIIIFKLKCTESLYIKQPIINSIFTNSLTLAAYSPATAITNYQHRPSAVIHSKYKLLEMIPTKKSF